MTSEDIVTSRIAGLSDLLEKLRVALADHLKEGWRPQGEDPAWLFNVGVLLGGCSGIDMADNPMALFNRIHRIHGALVQIRAPAKVLGIMKEIYVAAFEAQMAVVTEGGV